MKARKLTDSIILVKCDTQYELTSTFLRFQEHYESPKFAGRIFDLEEFADWYAKQYGKFSYYTDWAGFNVPGHVFDRFHEGQFDPLSRKEQRLLKAIGKINHDRKYYVIGVYKDATIKHELAHALYYVNEFYKKRVDWLLKFYNVEKIKKRLVEWGYAKHVLDDEVQAYLISGDLKGPKALTSSLRQLFKLHTRDLKL